MSLPQPVAIARVEAQPVKRTWGAWCGAQAYAVDLTVRSRTGLEPPPFMLHEFADPPGDGKLSVVEYVGGAGPSISRDLGCEVIGEPSLRKIKPGQMAKMIAAASGHR